MKIVAFSSLAALLLTGSACSREKVPTQKMDGYTFSMSPKATSARETVGMILGQVNNRQAQQAAAAGKDQHKALGLANEDGTVAVPLPDNTDYLVVSDSSAFQQILQAQNFGMSQLTEAAGIDFKREFVLLLIHPPVAFSGATFLDGLEAEVEADNTVRLELSSIALPATDTPGLSYGQYNYQVSVYKMPKKAFSRAHIVFDKQEDDASSVYVPL